MNAFPNLILVWDKKRIQSSHCVKLHLIFPFCCRSFLISVTNCGEKVKQVININGSDFVQSDTKEYRISGNVSGQMFQNVLSEIRNRYRGTQLLHLHNILKISKIILYVSSCEVSMYSSNLVTKDFQGFRDFDGT